MDLPPEALPLLATWKTTYMAPTTEMTAYLVVNIIFIILAVCIVGARVYTRLNLGAGMGWDDGIICAATPLVITLMVFQGVMSTTGCGYDLIDVIMAGNVRTFLLLVFIFQIVSVVVLGLVKISTCSFYLRVFRGDYVVWGSYILIGLTATYSLGFVLAVCLLCTPVQGNWDLVVAATAKCGDQMALVKSMITVNIFLDFFVMILPLYSVWQLKMRTIDKVGVIACFCIGIVMIVASIFRLVYIASVDLRANVTGTAGISIFIGELEPILSLIAVSLPMLRPLYAEWRKKHGGWSSGDYSASGSNELGNSRPMKLTGNGTNPGHLSSNVKVSAKARSRNDIELDTIFDDTHEKSGSEENLTDSKNGIQVHKQWEINVA